MTKCSKCGAEKPDDEFYQFAGKRHGYICKDCKRVYARNRPPNRNQYGYTLKKKYGLTQEQYAALVQAQAGRCYICEKKTTKRLCVDHRHSDGLVRGLLCGHCNYLLGTMHDNARLFARAGGYLDNPPAVAVIGFHRVPGAPPQTVEEAMEEQ